MVNMKKIKNEQKIKMGAQKVVEVKDGAKTMCQRTSDNSKEKWVKINRNIRECANESAHSLR